jgi:DNA-binding HxlR family transcriptional regulator
VVTAIPPRVEYALTALGQRVAGRLRDLADVLEDTVPEVEQARAGHRPR